MCLNLVHFLLDPVCACVSFSDVLHLILADERTLTVCLYVLAEETVSGPQWRLRFKWKGELTKLWFHSR